MSVINIREAERAGSRLVIALAGISGSGKTYSALQLAYGLANGNAKKVGLLDTENRRGSLYADCLKNKKGEVQRFLIGDLYAPFSPARYVEAILEFQKAGVEVLVIDSVSHEWNGLGGVLEIVGSKDKAIHGWRIATPEHRRFVNTALQSDMHLILCVRAANKVDWKDPKNPQSLGVLPIQREDFMFEMTASLMMWNEGKHQDIMKCPEELRPILGRGEGYLTARDGLALRQWVDGAVKLDPAIENARNTLRTMTEQGVAAVTAAWNKLPKATREALGAGLQQELLDAAQAFEDQRALAAAGDPALEDLNSQVLGNAAGTNQEEAHATGT